MSELDTNQILMKHEVEDLRSEITRSFTELKKDIQQVLVQATLTNGKVAELQAWKLRYEGGAIVLKGIWGFIGVYILAATGALLMMWSDYRNLEATIRRVVQQEVRGVVLEEISK